MDSSKVDKLKVVELRAELQARGLDSKGVKAILVERLRAAIESGTPLLNVLEDDAQTEVFSENDSSILSTPSKRRRRTRSMTRSPSPTSQKKLETELEPLVEEIGDDHLRADEPSGDSIDSKSDSQQSKDEGLAPSINEDLDSEEEDVNAPQIIDDESVPEIIEDESVPQIIEDESVPQILEDENTSHISEDEKAPEIPENENQVERIDESRMEQEETVDEIIENNKQPEECSFEENDITETNDVAKEFVIVDQVSIDEQEVADEDQGNKSEKQVSRKRTHSKSRTKSRSRSRSGSREHQSRSKSRTKSRSKSPKHRRGSPAKNIDDFTNEEDEPLIEDKQTGLSWYDSDLHLCIDPVSFTSAKPMGKDVFNLVWSAARANYGVREGKVCFEVRLSEETHIPVNFREEKHLRGFRCGYSTVNTPLSLGESEKSFAYCDSGKKAVNNEFIEYGKQFGLDDVIGCYLDLDSSPCTIKYTLNGEDLGDAFEFDKSDIIGDKLALFPHVATKGFEFQINFADSENLLGNTERPKRLRKKVQPVKETAEVISNETKTEEINISENEPEEKSSELAETTNDKPECNDEKPVEEEVEAQQDAEEIQNEKEPKETTEKTEEKVVEETIDDEKSADMEIGENQKEEVHEETEKMEVDKDVEKMEVDKDVENVEDRNTATVETNEKQEVAEDEMEEVEPEERSHVTLLSGYELIGLVSEDLLIPGPQRPDSRKDCEVFLLVGLPGAGKTHWVQNHIKENSDKRYEIIGADSLIDKMNVDGKPRRSLHVGKWDKVYELCLNCLSSLEEIATKRRRNFILDQTNVFASAQRRKMKGFGDFKRIAVVCIPNEDELKRRIDLKTEAGNPNTIREPTLDKLKANFTLPSDEFGWFEEVRYTALEGDEAKDEVKKYNEKGKKAMEANNKNKRQRRDSYRRDDRRRYDDRRRSDFRDSRWKGGNDRRGPQSSNRWGPPNRGPPQPWRDDRGYGGGGGGGGGSGGGGGGINSYDRRGGNRYSGNNGPNWGMNNRSRPDDNRYRSSIGGGGGGGRSDSYGSGSGGGRDYRDRYDRDRDRNGNNGGNRRENNYRSGSGNQRDFRAGHRDNRTEDSRGGYERSSSKFSSNDGYTSRSDTATKGTNSNNASNNKWGGNPQANWGAANQGQQHQGYWNYGPQMQAYATQQQHHPQHQHQQQQQWQMNSADPRQQQQWMAWWQQQQQQQQQVGNNQAVAAVSNQSQQYWGQYSQQAYTTSQSNHDGKDDSVDNSKK